MNNMLFNNLYASLSLPNLAEAAHAPLRPQEQPQDSDKQSYEYEDLLKQKSSVNYSILDILARASDVIVSNKITPKTEYYGFAIHLLLIVFLLVWLVWSFFPQKWFNHIGIYYYPDRWWQLAILSHVLVTMVYIYVGLALYNIKVETCPLDDLRTIVDEHAVVASLVDQDPDFESLKRDPVEYLWRGTSGVWDLPITTVLKLLYLDYDQYEVDQ